LPVVREKGEQNVDLENFGMTPMNAGGDSRTHKFESKATNFSNNNSRAGSISNSPKKKRV
jgi:hypothetical protein